jgi:hypothetical protein
LWRRGRHVIVFDVIRTGAMPMAEPVTLEIFTDYV